MSDPSLSEPLTPEGEARVRRNVADMLSADWGEDPGTEYHPEEMCQSDRDLIRLLSSFDVQRAALERLDRIARVEPRNAIGEAEFTDALGQSFTALHPGVRPVWKPHNG